MYILQISDLHLSPKSDSTNIKGKIHSLLTSLRTALPEHSDLVCCVLGDIVDTGTSESYGTAIDVLQYLYEQLRLSLGEEHVSIEILPGNHDICNGDLSEFNAFASKLLNEDICYSDEHSVRLSVHFGYNFCCISSALNGEYAYGQINFEELSEIPSNSILLTHHALISGDKDDSAPIRDGYQLQTILEQRNIITLLHGHTHGCKRYSVGNSCQVIGVGPLFKEVIDVSNQCNLIMVTGNSISRIEVFTYHGDRKRWDNTIIYERIQDNNYYGTSLYETYSRILNDGISGSPLYNLRFQIKQSYDDFESEIEKHFSRYKNDAEAWQSEICPSGLYYTHGELMNGKDTTWLEYVSNELLSKPTSKRAIIPLITKEAVFSSGDSRLVSFDVVQFGFPNDSCQELQITIYFRALELRNFLPVNLYETLIMANKLREKIRSIDSITICFFAFRAEVKENFGCYKKYRIEELTETDFCKLLADEEFQELNKLLYEMANSGNTVIEIGWLERLEKALPVFYNKVNKDVVLEQLSKTKKAVLDLKRVREHCSTYSETYDAEQNANNCIKALADFMLTAK